MKRYAVLIILLCLGCLSQAQTKKEKQVADAVERLRKAMVDADSIALSSLVSPALSYGHSGGHIDDQHEFVTKITSGKSDFVTIDLTAQTISVSKKTAIVRHNLNATTNDGGKPGTVKLHVMLVWQKLHGKWVLLARQAIKLT
ncbi:MAG: nuclear transport factor 2 family protein [Chitinophagaceae bacterium]